ncbi:MAG: type II secretion system protein GspM, partial [Solirubrobacteraceae bacterium]
MTARDRIVVIAIAALAVVAAVWLLAVAPEREKAAKLGGELGAAQAQLASAESQANAARTAERSYPTEYASLVNLGKAVPTDQEVPSLIVQLADASGEKRVEFSSITSVSSAGSSSSSSSATPAPAAAGFTAMPFTFVFSG